MFLEKLGRHWEEFALFLGFTGEEVGILQRASHGSTEQEIRNFSKVWRMPDLTKQINDDILHHVLEIANINPGAVHSLHRYYNVIRTLICQLKYIYMCRSISCVFL